MYKDDQLDKLKGAIKKDRYDSSESPHRMKTDENQGQGTNFEYNVFIDVGTMPQQDEG